MRSVALHDRRPLPQFEHPIVGGANHDVEHGTGGAAVYLVCMVGGKSALRASDKKAKQQLVSTRYQPTLKHNAYLGFVLNANWYLYFRS